MPSVTKNDEAWQRIFDKYSLHRVVEQHGYFSITAAEINEFREARLMAKMDHRANRPEIFREYGLSILPVGRGRYFVGDFDGYAPYRPNPAGGVVHAPPPGVFETLQYNWITSESVAVNCAHASGIFDDFLGQPTMPTVSGRMGGGCFELDLSLRRHGPRRLSVENPQIEIDIALEGEDCLALVEAKNTLFDDFIVRQLYYPYRAWQGVISKEIRPIYFVYSNGIITLTEYCFKSLMHYDSLFVKNSKRYSIVPCEISLDDIVLIAEKVRCVEEPEVPFPQADSFDRVVNLIEMLHVEGRLTREDVTTHYDFSDRQTNYYTDAGRYLGLIEKVRVDGEVAYVLSQEAKHILGLSHRGQQLGLAECVLRHQIFKEVFLQYVSLGYRPDREAVVDIMIKNVPYGVRSRDTFWRRAVTVLSWIDWILELQS